MAVTVSLYNHTATRFANGSNSSSDTYKVKFLTAATFDATHTTLAATGGTESTSGTGYTTGGITLANVVVNQSSNDAYFDADDVILTASGGSISAAYGIVFNDTDTDDPPVLFINFDGNQTAGDGTQFKILWAANGIISFTVA